MKNKCKILSNWFALFVLLFVYNSTRCQDLKYYRYDKDLLSTTFHKSRREALRKEMPDSSMAIFFSAPERNRANDDDYPFHQDPAFYYLTGFTEPNSVLVIFKSNQLTSGNLTDEILFVQDRDPWKESWTGRTAGPLGARNLLDIKTVLSTKAFDTTLISYGSFTEVWYPRLPKGAVDDKSNPVDLFDLVEIFKKKSGYPASNGDDFKVRKVIARLREIKMPEELTLLRKSISISVQAHQEMMKAAKPGMTEYQIQAVGEFYFSSNGAESVAYPSICGAGENSCIMHYESNRKTTKNGDLILLDMGAEYHGYAADITRTIPVNGKYSEAQKSIYQLVYDAQEAAFKECKPGNKFSDPHEAADRTIGNGLQRLGIINNEKETRNYFIHSTSHYLGLDVHDAGNYGVLVAGNVITVEPGIYIPEGSPCDPKWWNIGVRIEDDILITNQGFENLSEKAPRKWEDVEQLMSESSFFKNK